MPRERKEYVAPEIEKRDQLKEVAAGAATTVSGQQVTPKGGCFKKEGDSALDL
jgi:hypothetical protein